MVVVIRKRPFALASIGALVGALATGVVATPAATSSSPPGLTFTSQPGVANIVAHYVVSPVGGPQHAASASTDESPVAAL